jgi:four helix bundle protein
MAVGLEDLRVLQVAEAIADDIWKQVSGWDRFARDVVGGQLCKAADSIGANIAESFVRFSSGEKIQFLYYSRGSLFETKYWLNRVLNRELMASNQVDTYSEKITQLARQLNVFVASIKNQKKNVTVQKPNLREERVEYVTEKIKESDPFISNEELTWLASQSPISNL